VYVAAAFGHWLADRFYEAGAEDASERLGLSVADMGLWGALVATSASLTVIAVMKAAQTKVAVLDKHGEPRSMEGRKASKSYQRIMQVFTL
jgi:hypothetical protein